jgi:Zn-dependent protease
MLGWSINLFRVRGIMISLHFSFLLLLAYVCYAGWQEGGVPGLWWSAAIFLAIFICVVLHEFGHSFMAMRFGIHVRGILLMPIGGMAQFDSIPRRPIQEFLITAAGPAVNFAIAAVLWLGVDFPDDWDATAIPSSAGDLARLLLVSNLVMGIFNLIPAFPMDGGRILRALLATRIAYLRATFWAVTVAKVMTALGIAASLYFENYLATAVFIFIFLAGEAEYRSVKRQEVEEAQWKEALRRHLERASAGEPPVLDL